MTSAALKPDPKEKRQRPAPTRWMDMGDVCDRCRITERTVDSWIKLLGFPPGRPRGGKLFWDMREVDAWMDGGSDKVRELTLPERVRHDAREAANDRH